MVVYIIYINDARSSKYQVMKRLSYIEDARCLRVNVYRVSSLEIKRQERDVDQFAPPSAHFKLVELRLCSQYRPLFLGYRKPHVFNLPVSSKFTFVQRTWSGLVWSD